MADSRGETVAEVRYKAGDVCRMADVQPYVLRYWESEFSVLAPERGAPGPRMYTPRDVKIIERIKKLLYDEGYTIAGAKKRLEGELKSDGVTMVAATEPTVIVPPPLPRPRRVVTAPELEPAVEIPASKRAADVSEVALAAGPEAPVDVPIAASPEPDAKPRKRARGASPEPAGPVLFEASSEAAVEPTVRISSAAPEARLAGVVGELKEILALLSREEP